MSRSLSPKTAVGAARDSADPGAVEIGPQPGVPAERAVVSIILLGSRSAAARTGWRDACESCLAPLRQPDLLAHQISDGHMNTDCRNYCGSQSGTRVGSLPISPSRGSRARASSGPETEDLGGEPEPRQPARNPLGVYLVWNDQLHYIPTSSDLTAGSAAQQPAARSPRCAELVGLLLPRPG